MFSTCAIGLEDGLGTIEQHLNLELHLSSLRSAVRLWEVASCMQSMDLKCMPKDCACASFKVILGSH